MTIEVPEEPLHLTAPTSDPTQLVLVIERIATRMAEADLPVILLDADVARYGLTKPIVRLIEAHSIPFATLPAAKALIDESHELSGPIAVEHLPRRCESRSSTQIACFASGCGSPTPRPDSSATDSDPKHSLIYVPST